MEYDFELVHISGAKNGRADALSRHPDYDKGDDDNKKLVVLPVTERTQNAYYMGMTNVSK